MTNFLAARIRRIAGAGAVLLAVLLAMASTSGDATAETGVISSAEPDPAPYSGNAGPEPRDLSDKAPTDDVIPVVAEKIFVDGYTQGFAGIRTDYPGRAIHVYWAGPVPSSIEGYMDGMPLGVRVTVSDDSRYSRIEGEAARGRIEQSRFMEDLTIVSISVRYDGNGLEIGSLDTGPFVQDDIEELARVARVDVESLRFQYGHDEPMGYAQRNNDTSPWRGGIRTRHKLIGSPVGKCTAGFAVIVGGTGRLLGARHCDPGGNAEVQDGHPNALGNGETISYGGAAVDQKAEIDSLLIDPYESPATRPQIYRGGYSSGTYSTVKNWYSNWPGDPVCSSGGSTGEHCGTVYDDNENIYPFGVKINVIQVSSPAGSIMGGQGDSGAPMFKKVTGGVQARGILLGPDTDYGQSTSCGVINPDIVGSIYCSRYINYVPISTILTKWVATLEVG